MGLLSNIFDFDYTPVYNANCYEQDSAFDIAFGLLLTIGIYISWLPQQIEFIRKKSTFGVSSSFILLTQFANWSIFINALFLDYNDFQCCRYISFWQCQELMLPIYQLAISALSVTVIHISYVWNYTPTIIDKEMFHRGPDGERLVNVDDQLGYVELEESHMGNIGVEDYNLTKEELEKEHRYLELKVDERQRGRRLQVIIFFSYMACMAVLVLIGYLLIAATYPYSEVVVWYSYVLGWLGVLVVLFQFTPQIYTTFRLKESGSLSLVMLIIQSPGTWIWLTYLILAGQNWTTWFSTFVAALQVSVLLALVVWYDHIKPRIFGRKKSEVVEE